MIGHAAQSAVPKRGIVSQRCPAPTPDRVSAQRTALILLIVTVFGLGAGCRKKPKYRVPPPIPAVLGAKETGHASWYGHPYHGRRTSNGEVYDMDKMTAAHLRLPFGTWVRVKNLENGRRTEVRINDRGPFVKNRIIDLSREAARRIEMIGPGTARVRVEVIALPGTSRGERAPTTASAPPPETAPATPTPAPSDPSTSTERPCNDSPGYGVQVGSFGVPENAAGLRDKMNDAYGNARILRKETQNGPLYAILLGSGSDSYTANALMERLRRDNIDGFVVFTNEGEFLDCL
jgi:rare lipoprotein A